MVRTKSKAMEMKKQLFRFAQYISHASVLLKGKNFVEAAEGSGGVAQDVADRHEEREEGVGRPSFTMVTGGIISQQSPTRPLQHVVGDVEDPKSDHKEDDGTRLRSFLQRVAQRVAKIGRISDEEHCYGDKDCSGHDKRPATTEAGGASVTEVADDGLNYDTRDGTTKPNEGSPFMRDAEELDIGS